MNVKELTGPVLVDTSVLIYATLTNDTRHSAARRVLELRHREDPEVYVSTQNLAEMYPNLTGPKNNPPDPPSLARAKINSIADLSGITVLPVDRVVAEKALELCETYSITKQRYFDMQLAALMLLEGIRIIVTENTGDFNGIEGIKATNPFS